MGIKKNLIKAIEVIAMTPAKLVDLDSFQQEATCGTVHCTAGWLAENKFFKKQGMALQEHTYANHFDVVNTRCDNDDIEGGAWTDEMFGEDAYEKIFTARGDSMWDERIFSEHGKVSDKELALLRLTRALREHKKGK